MEEVLAKYFSDNLTNEERIDVDVWRGESRKNAEEFFVSKQIWKQSIEPKINTNVALNNVLNNIDNANNTLKESGVGRRLINWPIFVKYAAALIISVGLGYAYFNAGTLFGSDDVLIEITSTGSIKEITLPDASTVTLGRHSVLQYTNDFNTKTRKVSLLGKAFFDVGRDEDRPFIITTGNYEIRVLGTSFMVNTPKSGMETEVIVVSGKVAVTSKVNENINEPSTLELLAGESVNVRSNSVAFTKSTKTKSNFLAWKTSLINFDKEPLKSVFSVLNDIYEVNIELSDNNIKNCYLSAKFNQQSIDDIIEIISETFGLQFQKIDARTYKLTGSGCRVAN